VKRTTVFSAELKVGRLVLIMDDHPVIRRMLRAAMEAEEFQVSDAMDGGEGVRKALE
jgi:DNA-binding response OmpR family regulator